MGPNPDSGAERHRIDVRDLRVPVVMVLTLIVAVVTVSMGIIGSWYKTSAHAEDAIKHLDVAQVSRAGGPVYKQDLVEARSAITTKIDDIDRKQERRLRGLQMQCRSTKAGLNCRVAQFADAETDDR
jgi:hypothetical protein